MKRILVFLILISVPLFAQTANEIIDKAENLIKGKSAHGIIEMKITTPDYERTLKMESWWEGNEKALIVVKSPRKEAGNKTLKIKNEMWNYLKNTETTIKMFTITYLIIKRKCLQFLMEKIQTILLVLSCNQMKVLKFINF